MRGQTTISRRKAISLGAALGATSPAVLAQVPAPTQSPAQPSSSDSELEIARQQRLNDAQRIAAIPLPQSVEPAFQFRP